MISENAKEKLNEAIQAEKTAAIREHGLFHSQHEGWAVLREELEELCEEMYEKNDKNSLMEAMYKTWYEVRADRDMTLPTEFNVLYTSVLDIMHEATQVLAVMEKILETAQENSIG